MADFDSEILFTTAATAAQVSGLVAAGRARRLMRGVYTANTTDLLETIGRRNAWIIAGHFYPGAVIAGRTALELAPASDGTIVLAAERSRPTVLQLPGLRIRVIEGPAPTSGDVPLQNTSLWLPSRARAFLDNMRPSRARSGVAATLTQAEVEARLDSHARGDDQRLRALREDARALAPELGAEKELARLEDVIGAMVGTRPDQPLESAAARSHAAGYPYDALRLRRFEQLAEHLVQSPLAAVPAGGGDPNVLAFYEAYFSNYIEGTEFEVDEAQRIVFEGWEPVARPGDAHDILGTYQLVADPSLNSQTPASADELLTWLTENHAQLMAGRPEIGPGEFKELANRAGSTAFVEPRLVKGTLRAAWEQYSRLAAGVNRGAFAMFVIAEVHPFNDGNGRMARLLMNAEISHAQQQRIIVPTRLRDDYVEALRGLTHNGLASPYARVLQALQQTTAAIDYTTLASAELSLRRLNAFDEPQANALDLAAIIEYPTAAQITPSAKLAPHDAPSVARRRHQASPTDELGR